MRFENANIIHGKMKPSFVGINIFTLSTGLVNFRYTCECLRVFRWLQISPNKSLANIDEFTIYYQSKLYISQYQSICSVSQLTSLESVIAQSLPTTKLTGTFSSLGAVAVGVLAAVPAPSPSASGCGVGLGESSTLAIVKGEITRLTS